jgi:hypothetical protein
MEDLTALDLVASVGNETHEHAATLQTDFGVRTVCQISRIA